MHEKDTTPHLLAYNAFAQAASNNVLAANALCILLLPTLWVTGAAILTAASRITFAMARDGALPFSSFGRRLDLQRGAPVGSVVLVLVVSVLIQLIIAGSVKAVATFVNPYVFYCAVRCKARQ